MTKASLSGNQFCLQRVWLWQNFADRNAMKIFPTEFDGQSIRRVYDEATETWCF